MMLTHGKDFDVLDNDEFVVILMEDRIVHYVPDILLISLGEEQQCFGISFRCRKKSLAIRIFANALKNCSNSSRYLSQSLRRFLWRFFETFAGPSACMALDFQFEGTNRTVTHWDDSIRQNR